MQTMMERIAEAEQQADRILEEANAGAKDRVAAAREEAEHAFAASQEFERAKTAEAKETAERLGRQQAEEILVSVRGEIADLKRQCEAKIPKAVSYILERIAVL